MIEVVEYAGIIAGIVGLFLLYKYSMSPNIKTGSATYLYSEEESRKIKKIEDKQDKHYKLMSTIGFILSVTSMLISLWVRALK
jgi:hypothetical protein